MNPHRSCGSFVSLTCLPFIPISLLRYLYMPVVSAAAAAGPTAAAPIHTPLPVHKLAGVS